MMIQQQWNKPFKFKNSISMLIVLGIILYLRQYLTNRSLWLDEAAVSLDIIKLPISAFLHQPLLYAHQAAPFGFLAIEKIFVYIGGTTEFVLRLFPLISAIASLWLFGRMAKIYLKDISITIVVFTFIITPSLIYYASEVKPYASDVLMTLISYVFIAPSLLKELTRSKTIIISILGAAMPLFSFPIIFILSGIIMTVLGEALIKKNWPKISTLGSIFLLWFASFILCYTVLLKPIIHAISKNPLWQNGYLNLIDHTSLLNIFNNILIYPLGISHYLCLSGLLFLIGAYSFFMIDKKRFFFLLSPLFFVLLASEFHVFSSKDRLALFLIPIFLILIINGINTLASKTGPWKTIVTLLLVGILFYAPISVTYTNLIHPKGREEISTVLSYIKEHIQPNDVLYISNRSTLPFEYYQRRFNFHPDHYINEDSEQGLLNDLRKLSKFKRVWIIFSHYYPNANMNAGFLVSHLTQFNGKLLDTFSALDNYYSLGSCAYLFDLSGFVAPTKLQNKD